MNCGTDEGTPAIYTGEDIEIAIDLIDVAFADLTDVIVGVIVNKVLRKTAKKTLTGNAQVVAHPTNPNMCIVRLFRSETKDWTPGGMLSMEVTLKSPDTAFAAGKHVTYQENIVLFQQTFTRNS